MEIEIPAWLSEALLLSAAETECTVEEIVEHAIKSYYFLMLLAKKGK